MKLIRFVVVGVSLQIAVLVCPRSDYKQLTTEDAKRLAAWTPYNPEPVWEYSGQHQGDIVLAPAQRNGLIDKKRRWPKGTMPYEFHSALDKKLQQKITAILEAAFRKSCFKPRLRRKNDRNYVLVTGVRGEGCWSYVGRKGGCQQLNLDPEKKRCLKYGTVVHEFLHAAGFHHQQSDSDRDDYVDIFGENIRPGKYKNFRKYGSDVVESFGQEYDYGSIMHYGKYAFTKNKKPTLLPKDPNAVIGVLNTTDTMK